jgi:hypothetical protein
MDQMQIAVMLSNPDSTDRAFSALPDAPVVPHVEPSRTSYAVRRAMASGLRRLADTTAPPVRAAAHATNGRFKLSAGNGSGVATWDESRCRRLPSTSA